MTLVELAELMRQLGATEALNLDGGGSTTMVARRAGRIEVVNRPSDATGERPVANVLAVVRRCG
jgi:exopolysaccharide biosynthesis protein